MKEGTDVSEDTPRYTDGRGKTSIVTALRLICCFAFSVLLICSLGLVASANGCSFAALVAETAARAAGHEYQKAAEVGELAAECAKTQYGSRSSEYGQIKALLGSVYQSLGILDLAEGAYLTATLVLRKYPSKNASRVNVSNGLSDLYLKHGKPSDAEAVLKESIEITESHFGPKHPDLGRDLTSLATVYFRQGKIGEAIPLLERKFRILASAPVPDDSEIFKSIEFLSSLYVRDKKCPDAVSILSKGIAILDSTGISSDYRIGRLYLLLGNTYTTMSKHDEALAPLRKALTIARGHYPPDDPWLLTFCVRLAECYVRLDSLARADSLYDEALQIVMNTTSLQEGVDFGKYLRDYASLLRKMGQDEKAQVIERKGLNLQVPEK